MLLKNLYSKTKLGKGTVMKKLMSIERYEYVNILDAYSSRNNFKLFIWPIDTWLYFYIYSLLNKMIIDSNSVLFFKIV